MVDIEVSDAFRQRAKALMRRRFRSHRQGLPPSGVKARSEAIVSTVLSELDAVKAQAVASFWPMGKEVDLRPLHHALLDRGVRMAYPAIDDDKTMRFYWVVDPEGEMSPTAMGYLAPPLDHPVAEAVDVVLVPGIAFDPRGYRIGYGGGFYDRTLPRYAPPARTWGVGFDLQLAGDIPNVAHDVSIDRVITDRRVLETQEPEVERA